MRRLSPEARATLRRDLDACVGLLRHGSRSFYAASLVLPRSVREPATALYAFCRLADDAVDLGDDDARALAELRARLDALYAGRPHDLPADRAFARVVEHYAIPRALPEALLEGFVWDAEGRRYETLAELEAYATRVAGSVGAMMALLMGAREPEALARATDLGIAMQLSNIARDVGEDVRAGRLYLPLAWLREAGIDPDAWMAEPLAGPELAAVVQRLLRAADTLYERASAGIARLPRGCRPGMHAARLLYAGIGQEVERRGCDPLARRAVVPPSRKARLLMQALAACVAAARREHGPPVDAAAFLVQAAAGAPGPALPLRPGPVAQFRHDFDDRVAWLVDLFERLERRDQMEPFRS